MEMQYLMEREEMVNWEKLKHQLVRSEMVLDGQNISNYDLVYALFDNKNSPYRTRLNQMDVESFFVFSSPNRFEVLKDIFPQTHIKAIMLGEFVESLQSYGENTSIKINPILKNLVDGEKPYLYSEEVVFAPQFDSFTKKYLLTNPEDAKALLAIAPEDQKRFGLELVFYMVTDRDLPEEREEREEFLKNKIGELAFVAPRVPIRKGSGSFLVVLLNLENELEERAFIREYTMHDPYTDVIFVTSALKIYDGRLEEIHYNGENIDTIFSPLIRWQQSKQLRIGGRA